MEAHLERADCRYLYACFFWISRRYPFVWFGGESRCDDLGNTEVDLRREGRTSWGGDFWTVTAEYLGIIEAFVAILGRTNARRTLPVGPKPSIWFEVQGVASWQGVPAEGPIWHRPVTFRSDSFAVCSSSFFSPFLLHRYCFNPPLRDWLNIHATFSTLWSVSEQTLSSR